MTRPAKRAAQYVADDQREERDREAGAVFAARLRVEGGECDVYTHNEAGSCRGALCVTLTDGRVFTRTTLHGSGGLLSLHRKDTARLLRDVENVKRRAIGESRPITIYLVERYFGGETLDVHVDQLASVEIDPAVRA